MRFPTLGCDAAEYLIEKNIRGLGIDTLSPDSPHGDFPVHTLLLTAGIYIVENIKYVSDLPAAAGFLQIVPLAIVGGTESPVRAFFFYR